MLNRFYMLSKKNPAPLFLTENIEMDRIPTKIKGKMPAFFTLYFKFCRYSSHQIFYFLLFLLALTSGGIVFYKLLELHSTMSDKNLFVTNFLFLTDPLNAE